MNDRGPLKVRAVLSACVFACCFAGASLAEDGEASGAEFRPRNSTCTPLRASHHFNDTDRTSRLGRWSRRDQQRRRRNRRSLRIPLQRSRTATPPLAGAMDRDGGGGPRRGAGSRWPRRHVVSAREQLLRASNYYLFGLLAMMTDDRACAPRAAHNRATPLKEAGKALSIRRSNTSRFRSRHGDARLFRKRRRMASRAKTLLMLAAARPSPRISSSYIMPQAIERGYNFIHPRPARAKGLCRWKARPSARRCIMRYAKPSTSLRLARMSTSRDWRPRHLGRRRLRPPGGRA